MAQRFEIGIKKVQGENASGMRISGITLVLWLRLAQVSQISVCSHPWKQKSWEHSLACMSVA